MERLEIRLFGEFSVIESESGENIKLSHGTQALLSYLVLNRSIEHPRDDLSQIFWPEEDVTRARSRMNTAIWRLRKALTAGGVNPDDYIITRSTGEVGFNRSSNYWLDIEAFEETCAASIKTARGTDPRIDPDELEAVQSLYKGDVLRGFFSDWAIRERERFLDLHIKSLMRLSEHFMAQGQHEKAIDFAKTAITKEPLREDIHRLLIELYAVQGQRALALQQYRICKAMLEAELGVEPMPETLMVLEKGLRGQVLLQQRPTAITRTDDNARDRQLRIIRQKLGQAIGLIEDIQNDLKKLDPEDGD